MFMSTFNLEKNLIFMKGKSSVDRAKLLRAASMSLGQRNSYLTVIVLLNNSLMNSPLESQQRREATEKHQTRFPHITAQ